MFNQSKYKKEWYLENKERLSKVSRERYYKNKTKIGERRKENLKLLRENNPQKYQEYLNWHKEYNRKNRDKSKERSYSLKSRFAQYCCSAKRRNYEFSLDYKEFSEIMNKDCHYCRKKIAWGIDRKDNKIGYTKDNSVPCCEMCNKLKWRWSEKEFKNQIVKIYKHIKQ